MVSEITDLLDERRVPYKRAGEHEHVRHGWVGIDCPQCSPDWSHFRLGYNLGGAYCSCWVCGYIPLAEVLRDVLKVRSNEARRLAGQLRGNREWIVEKERIPGRLVLPSHITPMAGVHRQYLRDRKLDPDEIARVWGVQGIGLAPRLSWRLFIPITLEGKVVSWTTRMITERTNGRRYLSAGLQEETIHHKHLLYGEDYVRHTVMVCEGPFDVWRIGPGAVAVLGVQYTREQVNRLRKYTDRIILFDAEEGAQHRAKALMAELSSFPGRTRNVVLEKAKDPGEAGCLEIRETRKLLTGEQT